MAAQEPTTETNVVDARPGISVLPVRYQVLAVTFLLSMLLYVDRIAISTARDPIVSTFGLSDNQFGWILSVFALGYVLFQAPAGVFADRHGPRLVLTLVLCFWSLFTGLTGVMWSFGSLLLCRFLFGGAEAGAYPTFARVFYSWLPASELGLAQGINLSGSRLGAAFALPAVAWLVNSAGWRPAFFLLGLVGFLWALVWYAWFRDNPEEHSSVRQSELETIESCRTRTATVASTAVGPILRSTNVWMMMGQYFASNFTFFFCLTWMFPYLQRTYNLSAVRSGLMGAVPLLGGAAGNWVGGALVDAIHRRGLSAQSRKLPAIIGFSLSALAILSGLKFHSLWGLVCCLTIAIFGSDMTLPAGWAFCIDIGRSNTGKVGGLMNMAGNAGSFATSLAFPYLLSVSGSVVPFFVAAALFNFGALFLWTRTKADTYVIEE